MRKRDKSYLICEAMSFCFKQKFKVFVVPNRGGSMKSPPKCKIVVSNKGKLIRGTQEYEQDSKGLTEKINNLYLKHYEENCPKDKKIVIKDVSHEGGTYVDRSGKKRNVPHKKSSRRARKS